MKLNVILFHPEIPQNTGNIMRTCVGVGAKLHLIKPLGFSLDEKHLRRSAVDYYEFIEYELYEDFDDFLAKNPNARIYFSTRYGHKPLSSFDLTGDDRDLFLMFGCESSGIPYEILANNIDTCFRLPTNDKVRSLNLSNCVAVALFEALRQFDYLDLLQEEPDTLKGANFLDQFKE